MTNVSDNDINVRRFLKNKLPLYIDMRILLKQFGILI
jgi:hypothetical protein